MLTRERRLDVEQCVDISSRDIDAQHDGKASDLDVIVRDTTGGDDAVSSVIHARGSDASFAHLQNRLHCLVPRGQRPSKRASEDWSDTNTAIVGRREHGLVDLGQHTLQLLARHSAVKAEPLFGSSHELIEVRHNVVEHGRGQPVELAMGERVHPSSLRLRRKMRKAVDAATSALVPPSRRKVATDVEAEEHEEQHGQVCASPSLGFSSAENPDLVEHVLGRVHVEHVDRHVLLKELAPRATMLGGRAVEPVSAGDAHDQHGRHAAHRERVTTQHVVPHLVRHVRVRGEHDMLDAVRRHGHDVRHQLDLGLTGRVHHLGMVPSAQDTLEDSATCIGRDLALLETETAKVVAAISVNGVASFELLVDVLGLEPVPVTDKVDDPGAFRVLFFNWMALEWVSRGPRPAEWRV